MGNNNHLPADPEAEAAVLGALLLDPDAYGNLPQSLKPSSFADRLYAQVFKAYVELRRENMPVDDFVLLERLSSKRGTRRDWVPVVATLTNGFPRGANIRHYAEIVLDRAQRRRLLKLGQRLLDTAAIQDQTPAQLRQSTREILDADDANGQIDPVLHSALMALEPQPAIPWILDPLISEGSVSLFVGDGGSKKTWSLLDLAVCVAMGKWWLNFHTSRSNVLIIDEESGKNRLSRRLGDVMRAHQAPAELPLWYTCLQGFNLLQPESIARIRALIAQTEARIVLFDALADFMRGGDENSVQDTQPVFHALRTIAETMNCGCVMIHHNNKSGQYRGSTGLKAAVDLMMAVESENESSLVTFTCEKARDSIIRPFSGTAHFEIGKFWLSGADPKTQQERFNRSERYVLEFLTKQSEGMALLTDITANASSCSPSGARNAIYALAERGLVERSNPGTTGIQASYRLKSEASRRIPVFSK
jgi:hypothetical protein